MIMLRQLSRFAGVGVAATLVHITMAILAEAVIGLPAQAANLVGFATAVGVSYFGHLHFTFGVVPDHATHGARFVVVAISGLLTSSAITWAVHEQIGVPFAPTMVIVATSVPAVSFLLMRFWVFTERDGDTPSRPDWMPAAIAFLLVSLFTAGPVLLHPYLPLVDLPNHIARLHIMGSLDGPLSEYYSYEFRLMSNAAVDVIWTALGAGLDPVRFSQWTIAFYCVSFVAATMYLSRVIHGKWSIWPAAAALLVYNANFYWGFQNFIFSLGFAIAGFALVLQSERWPLHLRFLLVAVLSASLFVMHLFAFVGLALATFGREAQRVVEAGPERRAAFWRMVVVLLPFAGPSLWFLADILYGPESPLGSRTEYGNPIHRLSLIESLSLGVGRELPASLVLFGIAALYVLVFAVWTMFRPIGGSLVVHNRAKGALIALFVGAMLIPSWLNGVAFLHVRIPILLAAVFLAATHWEGLSARRATILASAVLAIIAARGVAFERYAASHSAEMRDLIAISEAVPAGARMLPVLEHPFTTDRKNWHISAYAVTQHDIFVPTVFQGTHALRLHERWKDHATPSLFPPSGRWLNYEERDFLWQYEFIDEWPRKYTHLIMLEPDTSDLAAYDVLEELDSRGRFTLYRITAPPSS